MFSSNASSADAGGVNYIEDVFQTWLYKGNDSTQTITNNIDLSTKGGLVFIKNRTNAYGGFAWYDTVRGAGKLIVSNSTAAQVTAGAGKELTSFNSTGFSLGPNDNADVNLSPDNYGSWTFREQEKFFDVVTYTGTGAVQNIAHNLGSVPGCIIVKRTDSSTGGDWFVYHRSTTATSATQLNSTGAAAAFSTYWNNTDPTSTQFTVASTTARSGGTYVAYLFAHDAGGFGLTGTDNVISCGSFTTDGSGVGDVTLGYEPQWLMIKRTDTTENWMVFDTMRGFVSGPAVDTSDDAELRPNTTAAESIQSRGRPNATGFQAYTGYSSATYIYIAIRRGPMKVPTDGTKVFAPVFGNGSGTTPNFPSNIVTDLGWMKTKNNSSNIFAGSRLQGANTLFTNLTSAESASSSMTWDSNSGWGSFGRDSNNIAWSFKRAPGFFDEVCWTGVSIGTADTIPYNHNLGVIPELVICKSRYDGTRGWGVWAANNNVAASATGLSLNTTAAALYPASDFTAYMTSTIFTPGVVYNAAGQTANFNTWTYVGYLFASCPGVSKVGGYTGTGTTLQVNCGFTGGARFVMIKRIDSTGDWYVWDSARGIVAGDDPYLLLNSASAEVTSTDYVDTYAAGFELTSTAPAALNASGGTYIFLAIA